MMYRTLMFVPATNNRFIEKAKNAEADIICFDLEDSVPTNEKEFARQNIVEALRHRSEYRSAVYVRINSVGSGLANFDLKAAIQDGIDGVVVPKVNDENVLYEIDDFLCTFEKENIMKKNSIKLMASIESAKGVANAYAIGKAIERTNALVFGVFDFLYDMHLDYGDIDGVEYRYAHMKIPVDARAAGVAAIDAVWQKIDDAEGLKKDSIIAKRLGYTGKCIIHPAQTQVVHKAFMPNKNEVEWAKKVVATLSESIETGSGVGAFRLEGKMIDAVHYKQAKGILDALDEHK
jgi:citrate lyase subunit beta / citryl-CoA lyase